MKSPILLKYFLFLAHIFEFRQVRIDAFRQKHPNRTDEYRKTESTFFET